MKLIVQPDECNLGDFMIIKKDPEESLTSASVVYADFAGAEDHAQRWAKEKIGRRVFVLQVQGEYRSAISVQQVETR
jgi:hypothetical protein